MSFPPHSLYGSCEGNTGAAPQAWPGATGSCSLPWWARPSFPVHIRSPSAFLPHSPLMGSKERGLDGREGAPTVGHPEDPVLMFVSC